MRAPNVGTPLVSDHRPRVSDRPRASDRSRASDHRTEMMPSKEIVGTTESGLSASPAPYARPCSCSLLSSIGHRPRLAIIRHSCQIRRLKTNHPTGGPERMHIQKRVLVTGGAGFLGSHLCERLLQEGANVISVDNYFTGTRLNIE